jgi:hypothetical protein
MGVTYVVKKTVVVERFQLRPLIKCKFNDTSKAKHYTSKFCGSLECLHVQRFNPTRYRMGDMKI